MTPLLTIAWDQGAVVFFGVIAFIIVMAFVEGFASEARRDWQQYRKRQRIMRRVNRR